MAEKTHKPPSLNQFPTRHVDCCLSLSSTLFDRILLEVSRCARDDGRGTILSIGSGSGLLESLLLDYSRRHCPKFQVEGVEVQQPDSQSPVNKYLPEQHYHTVQTTSTVSSRLYDEDVRAVMFVYPRQSSLVKQYIEERGGGKAHFDTAIWLGPRADWNDFSSSFHTQSSEASPSPEVNVLSGQEAGLEEYELMAVVRFGLRHGMEGPHMD